MVKPNYSTCTTSETAKYHHTAVPPAPRAAVPEHRDAVRLLHRRAPHPTPRLQLCLGWGSAGCKADTEGLQVSSPPQTSKRAARSPACAPCVLVQEEQHYRRDWAHSLVWQ